MLNFNIERFKSLPRQPGLIWQGGVFKMPAWLPGQKGKPTRPLMAIWIDVLRDHAGAPHIVEDADPFEAALNALLDFGFSDGRKGHRPFAIEVSDPALAAFLEEKLGTTDTRIDRVTSLRALEPFVTGLAEHVNKRVEPPAALSGKGVGLEQMRSFAAAASKFYKAKPWNELTDEDLIAIEGPAAPAGMDYVSVMGHGGMEYGLAFFDSLKQYEKMHEAASPGRFLARNGVWSMTFDDITYLPFADADLWEDHDLPVASAEAYPCAIWYGPKERIRRPNESELAFLEGLMLAIAETATDQLDHGKWTRRVRAGGREIDYCMSLVPESGADDEKDRKDLALDPQKVRRAMEKHMANLQRLMVDKQFDSLDQANAFIQQQIDMDAPLTSASRTPLEEAQELMYEAWDASARRGRVLAKKALDICPDCADAYVLLAEEAGGPAEAAELFQRGVEAGERALGPALFKDEAGCFWGLMETRPYMRARFGLAQCLWALGNKAEAVSHYEELLRLNPDDNQGVRYLLAASLLELNDDDKLDKLIRRYDKESSAQWLYIRALSAYRKDGDSKTSRKVAKQAIKNNSFVPAFLTGRRRLPTRLPDSYQMGHEDEAMICAAELRDEWKATPGAIEWLSHQQAPRAKPLKGDQRRWVRSRDGE